MHRLLLIDDNPDNVRPLVRLFKGVGIDARSATSGADGLAAIAARVPHLVLLDVMMPGMDGFDVLRAIRADPGHDGLPVLMYTADTDAATRARAMAMRAQGYVVKGTGFADIHAEVRRHLRA